MRQLVPNLAPIDTKQPNTSAHIVIIHDESDRIGAVPTISTIKQYGTVKSSVISHGILDTMYKPFDPKTVQMDSIFIIGKRQTGKTTLVRDLLATDAFLNQHHTVVINPMEPLRPEYTAIAPPLPTNMTIHSEFRKQIVNAFIRTTGVPSTIIFDTCMYSHDWTKNNSIKRLFTFGRNLKAKKIVVSDYPYMIPQSYITDIDYVFIFKESYLPCRKILYERYAQVFPSLEEFNIALDYITKDDHTCMVINNTAKSDDPIDQVMFYKAPAVWRRIASNKSQGLDNIREELMQRTWHPSRLKWCLPYDEVEEIFGSNNKSYDITTEFEIPKSERIVRASQANGSLPDDRCCGDEEFD